MIAYRLSYLGKIEKVEVERFTPYFVVLKTKTIGGRNQRDARHSGWYSYYETWEKAVVGIKQKFIKEIDRAKKDIHRAQIGKEELEAKYENFLANIDAKEWEVEDEAEKRYP